MGSGSRSDAPERAYSRMAVGWSIAEHMRAELVVDALQTATWRHRPAPGAIVHADRGARYTSWIFGHRVGEAGLLGPMGAGRAQRGRHQSCPGNRVRPPCFHDVDPGVDQQHLVHRQPVRPLALVVR